MLLTVAPFITGELLKVMDEMGHNDELVIVNRNYPAFSSGPAVVRPPTTDVVSFVEALLEYFPLDDFVEQPLGRMVLAHGDEPTEVQSEILSRARVASGRALEYFDLLRPEFYERARTASAVVLVGEAAPVSCFVLRKGVVR